MNKNLAGRQSVLGLALILGTMSLAHAGPPFMTDDPEPIEYQHSEAYLFSTFDKGPDGKVAVMPGFEFNTSPAPDWHLHLLAPFVALRPNDGSNAYGLGDIELGAKYRFVHETDSRPQVGIFPMIELPTGDKDSRLGEGRVWGSFPLWIQKSFGLWTTYGGGGVEFHSAPEMKNAPFAGWLLQRSVTESLILGGEVFYQGATRVGGQEATLLNIGGYYNTIQACGGCSLLFRVGASVAGEVHHEGYLGLYWTWGPEQKT